MENGAAWVTQKDHWIFNIDNFKPAQPLNTKDKWVALFTKDDGNKGIMLCLSESSANSFCNKIIETCKACKYSPKSFEENKNYLKNLC